MRLLLVRHPVTLANIEGKVQHDVSGDIAPLGFEQIKKTVARLQREKIDSIYSSDADRCRPLAEAISQSAGIPIFYHQFYREINNGVWNGMKKDAIARLSHDDPLNVRPLQGESLGDLAQRAQAGLDYIYKTGGENNLLISSGWFLKMLLGQQLGMDPVASIKYLKFSNCAISELQLHKEGCLVEYLNNREHLR